MVFTVHVNLHVSMSLHTYEDLVHIVKYEG